MTTKYITITGKNVQDTCFRSLVEHIGRSFGIHGVVYNSRQHFSIIRILCSGDDKVLDDFILTVRARFPEIVDLTDTVLPEILLPEVFSRIEVDDQ